MFISQHNKEVRDIIIIILLIIAIVLFIWFEIDNLRIKRKITRLNQKVEHLSQLADIQFKPQKEELSDEFKLYLLQRQIDSLKSLILNRNCQDKDQTDKQ